MVMNIKIQELICKRCSHNWVPRNEHVFVCPKCKSPRWNEDSGIMRVPRDIEPRRLLEIIDNNGILHEDLMIIGNVVRI
jgi:uncharacterized Zn ribbon protein